MQVRHQSKHDSIVDPLDATESSISWQYIGTDGAPGYTRYAYIGDPAAPLVLLYELGAHSPEYGPHARMWARLLANPEWLQRQLGSEVALVVAGPLNTYGMLHTTRSGPGLRDPNRGHDPAQRVGSPHYGTLRELLEYEHMTPWELARKLCALYRHELRYPGQIRQVHERGQTDYPHGLFYVGASGSPCRAILRQILRATIGPNQRVVALLGHTGVGDDVRHAPLVRSVRYAPGTQEFGVAQAVCGGLVESTAVPGATTTAGIGNLDVVYERELGLERVCTITIEAGHLGPTWTFMAIALRDAYLHLAQRAGRTCRVRDALTRRLIRHAFDPHSMSWRRAADHKLTTLLTEVLARMRAGAVSW